MGIQARLKVKMETECPIAYTSVTFPYQERTRCNHNVMPGVLD